MNLGQPIQGLRIGFPRHFFNKAEGLSREVVELVEATAKKMAELGAIVEEVTLPDFALFNACGRIIMTAEGYSIHEQESEGPPA